MPGDCQYMGWEGATVSHTRTMNIRLDHDVDTTDTVKLNLLILVVAPVTNPGHVSAAGIELRIA